MKKPAYREPADVEPEPPLPKLPWRWRARWWLGKCIGWLLAIPGVMWRAVLAIPTVIKPKVHWWLLLTYIPCGLAGMVIAGDAGAKPTGFWLWVLCAFVVTSFLGVVSGIARS
mgnify:CR=1 FL=1